jgi:hypothetical protein
MNVDFIGITGRQVTSENGGTVKFALGHATNLPDGVNSASVAIEVIDQHGTHVINAALGLSTFAVLLDMIQQTFSDPAIANDNDFNPEVDIDEPPKE